MMTMMRMTMMMMMMSMRINHNNALSDSFSASIISDLNSSNEDIQNPKLEHYAALATYFLGAKVSTIIFCEVSFRLSQSIDLNIL